MQYTAVDENLGLVSKVLSTKGQGANAPLLRQSIFLSDDAPQGSLEVPSVYSQYFTQNALAGNDFAAIGAHTWYVNVTFEGVNQLGQTITTSAGVSINIVKADI